MIDVNYYAANKMKQLRIQNGLTQQQLAEKTGVSQQQIAKLESNKRMFKQDFLFKLANVFDISINDFAPNDNNFDEIELLYRLHKSKLTDDDKAMIKFIIEKRR